MAGRALGAYRGRVRALIGAAGGIGILAAATLAGGGAGATGTAVARATVAPTCGGVTIAKPGGGTWTCTADDEFNGTALDATSWTPLDTAVVGNHPGAECDEPSALSEGNGVLAITATRYTTSVKCGRYSSRFYSGGITSTFAQTYGRFSFRAMFPSGKGFQPAIWMLPQNPNQPAGYTYGEIDVAESYSFKPDVVAAHLHYVKTPNRIMGMACNVTGATTGFHTYTLEWTPTTLTWIYDDTTCWTTSWIPDPRYTPRGSTSPVPFNQPFYLIVNLAIGNYQTPRNQPDRRTAFPVQMLVDYIRVWS